MNQYKKLLTVALLSIPFLVAAKPLTHKAKVEKAKHERIHERVVEVVEVEEVNYWRKAWGAEVAVLNGGYTNLSLVRATPGFMGGISVGATLRDDDDHYNVSAFGGPRCLVYPATYLGWGLDLDAGFGRTGGIEIDDSYSAGIYVEVNYYLSTQVMASAFIDPYRYHYEHLEGQGSFNTHHILNSGGLGIAYLFN